MKAYDLQYLKEIFYFYWMTRVPELDELEAIDHLEWELRSCNFIPELSKGGTVSSRSKKLLKRFLKDKNINTKNLFKYVK